MVPEALVSLGIMSALILGWSSWPSTLDSSVPRLLEVAEGL
jgi:hypothetical protein